MTDSENALFAEFNALLEKSTLSTKLDVGVSGAYPSEDDARKLANDVLFFLKMFGAFLHLDGLDFVTIADDYAGALAEVERGFETNRALTPTDDEFGTGLAMAVPILWNGTLKTHIVMHSGLAKPLIDPKHEWYSFAVHTLAHEAAHAHDHSVMSRTLPGLYGRKLWDFREGHLFNLAHGCWSEYIACRLSSPWGTQTYCAEFEPTLCSMLSTAMDRGTACIWDFSRHQDIVSAESVMREIYGTLLTRVSYLIGHVHGVGATLEEKAPQFYKLVNETPWFKPIFEQYEANLKALNDTYGDWTGLEVFTSLIQTCEAMLNAGGMFYNKQPNGQYFVGLNYPEE